MPFPAFAFSTSFFVLAISFRFSRNLGGNLPFLTRFSLKAFRIAGSDFLFSRAPSIPNTSLYVASIDFSWTRLSICSRSSWIRLM